MPSLVDIKPSLPEGSGRRGPKGPRYFFGMTFFVQYEKRAQTQNQNLLGLIEYHGGISSSNPRDRNLTHYLVSVPPSSTSVNEVTIPRHYLSQKYPHDPKRWDVYDVLLYTTDMTQSGGDEIIPSKKVFSRGWVEASVKSRKLLPSKDWQIKWVTFQFHMPYQLDWEQGLILTTRGTIKTVPRTPSPKKVRQLDSVEPGEWTSSASIVNGVKDAMDLPACLPARPFIPQWGPEIPPFRPMSIDIAPWTSRKEGKYRAPLHRHSPIIQSPLSLNVESATAIVEDPHVQLDKPRGGAGKRKTPGSLRDRMKSTAESQIGCEDLTPIAQSPLLLTPNTPIRPEPEPHPVVEGKSSPIFKGALGLALSFHVLGSPAAKVRLELLITTLGGGDIVALAAATFIVIQWAAHDVEEDTKNTQVALAQVAGTTSRMVVESKWIDDCCDAGQLIEPNGYRVRFPHDGDSDEQDNEDDIDRSLDLDNIPAAATAPLDTPLLSHPDNTATSSTEKPLSPPHTPRATDTRLSDGRVKSQSQIEVQEGRDRKRLRLADTSPEVRKDYDYLTKNLSIWLRTPNRGTQAKFLEALKPPPCSGGGWLAFYMRHRKSLLRDHAELEATR